jgi:hypothetical protein
MVYFEETVVATGPETSKLMLRGIRPMTIIYRAREASIAMPGC